MQREEFLPLLARELSPGRNESTSPVAACIARRPEQRLEEYVGVLRGSHRPADNLTGEQINHDR
jgi:hypothetical protein